VLAQFNFHLLQILDLRVHHRPALFALRTRSWLAR
jgi:hypothetical protein